MTPASEEREEIDLEALLKKLGGGKPEEIQRDVHSVLAALTANGELRDYDDEMANRLEDAKDIVDAFPALLSLARRAQSAQQPAQDTYRAGLEAAHAICEKSIADNYATATKLHKQSAKQAQLGLEDAADQTKISAQVLDACAEEASNIAFRIRALAQQDPPAKEVGAVVSQRGNHEAGAVGSDAPALSFHEALQIAKERFAQNPNWKRLDGTPWKNDAPVIAAELMVKLPRESADRIAQLERERDEALDVMSLRWPLGDDMSKNGSLADTTRALFDAFAFRTNTLRARLEAVCKAAKKAEVLFAEYAVHHQAKSPPDTQKVKRNLEAAEALSRAVQEAGE